MPLLASEHALLALMLPPQPQPLPLNTHFVLKTFFLLISFYCFFFLHALVLTRFFLPLSLPSTVFILSQRVGMPVNPGMFISLPLVCTGRVHEFAPDKDFMTSL